MGFHGSDGTANFWIAAGSGLQTTETPGGFAAGPPYPRLRRRYLPPAEAGGLT